MNGTENAEKRTGHTVDFKKLKEELMLFTGQSAGEEFNHYRIGDDRYKNCIDFIFCEYGLPEGSLNKEIFLDAAIESLEADIAKRAVVLDILKKYAAGDA